MPCLSSLFRNCLLIPQLMSATLDTRVGGVEVEQLWISLRDMQLTVASRVERCRRSTVRKRDILATGLRGVSCEFLRRCLCLCSAQSRGERCSDHVASEAAAVAAAAVEAVGFHCGYFRAVQSSAGAASGTEDVHQFPLLSRTVSRGHFLSLHGAGTEGSCAALQVRSTAADGE